MSYIEFKNVSKCYNSGSSEIKALDNISFEIEKGKFTVILGPSGSGKSTTLNLLGGMDIATSGTINVASKEITKLSLKQLTNYRRNDIGFVFQFYNLIPNLTAYENVDIVARQNKDSIPAKEALESVGLSHRLNNFPSQLSGGELQRVSIARALCKKPILLLCDEPTGALDSETGRMVLIMLQDMAKKYDNAVVVVTHNAAIAPAADRLIQLRDGKILNITDNENPVRIEEVQW
jgi:putative ABC transport system ATP-binding protein